MILNCVKLYIKQAFFLYKIDNNTLKSIYYRFLLVNKIGNSRRFYYKINSKSSHNLSDLNKLFYIIMKERVYLKNLKEYEKIKN